MSDDSSFHRLMNSLEAGEAAAAERLFAAYFKRLARFAYAKIDQRYHAKADPEVIADSVLRTFFRRHQLGEFDEILDSQSLWRLLAHIAFCRCCNQLRKQRGPDGDREKLLFDDVSFLGKLGQDAHGEGEVIVADLIDRASLGFSNIEKQIVDMTLTQWEVDDIASNFDISGRTVLRVREKFRTKLQKLLTLANAD